MMPVKLISCACLIAILGLGVASAQVSTETADSFSKRASGKFGRGIVNLTTGWGELIRCPVAINRERGLLLGATWGPLKGIAMTVIRTVSGAFETALFFYPLPGNYEPFLRPEFIWPGDIFIKRSLPAPASSDPGATP
jgi:putative exosortase-associated protein (TIGR04073 family)